MKPLIQLKTASRPLFIALALICPAAAGPKAQAVIPAPDGGYPGGNTAEGQNALLSLTTGGFNAAVGWFSLKSLTTGSFNTGVGAGTLVLNTGDQNTAVGTAALLLNTAGTNNTAVGAAALLNNSGFTVDAPNGGPGSANTAVGARALFGNTTGFGNTANGAEALSNNTTGVGNTVTGAFALNINTTGNSNIALGFSAGANITGDDNIDIGSTGGLSESGTIRIGQSGSQTSTFIAGIRGVTTSIADAIPVMIDSSGQLGTASSSRRFKNQIKPMDQASEAIHALKPVTFHYKSDSSGTPQFGLIAEEVAEVNPDLVVRDEKGEIYTVRYDAVNAMLLNEFLKEHRKNEEQEATIAHLKSDAAGQETTITELKKDIEVLRTQLKEQAAQIQRVSARVETNECTSQIVAER
jgi:hypothetical protein